MAGARLGIRATLFNFWVNYDFTSATSIGHRAIVGVAGPLACLFLGLISWFAYRRARQTAAGLPLLFLAASGVANFFGNLMSAAFVGDFSNAATVLGLPSMLRYTASLIGVVAVLAILFAAGREVWQWTPRQASRVSGVLGMIVLPVVIGTVYLIVVNQPTPMGAGFVTARVVEGALWMAAVVGALTARRRDTEHDKPLAPRWFDLAALVLTTIVIKIAARGIVFTP